MNILAHIFIYVVLSCLILGICFYEFLAVWSTLPPTFIPQEIYYEANSYFSYFFTVLIFIQLWWGLHFLKDSCIDIFMQLIILLVQQQQIGTSIKQLLKDCSLLISRYLDTIWGVFIIVHLSQLCSLLSVFFKVSQVYYNRYLAKGNDIKGRQILQLYLGSLYEFSKFCKTRCISDNGYYRQFL